MSDPLSLAACFEVLLQLANKIYLVICEVQGWDVHMRHLLLNFAVHLKNPRTPEVLDVCMEGKCPNVIL